MKFIHSQCSSFLGDWRLLESDSFPKAVKNNLRSLPISSGSRMDFDLLNYKGEFKFGEWKDFVSATAI